MYNLNYNKHMFVYLKKGAESLKKKIEIEKVVKLLGVDLEVIRQIISSNAKTLNKQ